MTSSNDVPTEPENIDSIPTESLQAKVRAGVLFLGLGNAVARIARISIQFLLYWLLDPEDFGIFAMAIAFVEVLQMLSEFGVGMAIIQKHNMPAKYADSAFWLNLIVSLLMVVIVWFGAPILARFYDESAMDTIVMVLRVSSLNFIVLALRTIPMALLRKEMKFGKFAALDAVWNTATGVLSVLFAFAGARYWSLVVPQMVTGLMVVPVWYYLAQWRPSASIDGKLLREIFLYSRFVVGSSLLAMATGNFGFVIAGHFHGTEDAGIYKFAMQNSSIIVLNFAWLVANATMSGFAIKQKDPEQLRSAFVRVFDALVATTLPFHVLLFVLTPQIFEIFPEKWSPAIPAFRVLLVMGALRSVTAHHIPLFNSIGRADITFRYFLVNAIVGIPMMYYGCRFYGLVGLAWGTTLLFVGATVVMLLITPNLLGWDRIRYVRNNIPFIIASVFAAIVAFTSANLLQMLHLPAIVDFFTASAAGGSAYLVVLYFGSRNRLHDVLELAVPERLWAKYLSRLFPET